MPTIDFAKPESLCLFLHVIHQAGPSNERTERANHVILTDEAFCAALLSQLRKALEEMSENWAAWRAAVSFSLIVRRILSLTLSNAITERCFQHLDTTRELCAEWLRLLKDRILSSSNDQQRIDLHRKISQVAWLYTSTFDVEEHLFEQALKEPTTVSFLVECCILIQENAGSIRSDSNCLDDVLLSSWHSLMYRILPKLHETILADSSILNNAVAASWADFEYDEDAVWLCLEEPQHLWFTITSGTRSVYFNLLTAELVVDGAPLARLPSQYIQNPAYITLFHDFAMEAGPTLEAGFRYAGKSTYHGFHLHFGMEENKMRILAVSNDIRVELVPSDLFKDRLPESLVRDFTHWYDPQHDQVEFRPHENPWPAQTTDTQWLLTRNSHSWRLCHGVRGMVSIESATAKAISEIFSPLEDLTHVHILFDTTEQTVRPSLEIELPRLSIGFDLHEGGCQINSRQYVGMCIDPDQRIGTLVGLENKLVLKSSKMRIVLVPDGLIEYKRNTSADHINVTIKNGTAKKVRAYELDHTLRRIRDDGSVQSKLLLAYLLALTSHCLPNPQSHTTGIEASLEILQSASLRSFETLQEDEIASLIRIGHLSVTHRFLQHEANPGSMQQITWDDDLYPSTQHLQLREEAKDVLEQARKTALFYPASKPIPDLDELGWDASVPFLEKRAAIRSSTFRVCGFGAEKFTPEHDLEYMARDSDNDSGRGRRVYLASTLTIREEPALHTAMPDLKSYLIANHFAKTDVKGPTKDYEVGLLRYDPVWLDNSSTVLQGNWCNIHASLRKLSDKDMLKNRWKVMMFLSTLAYAARADMTTIQALCAIFRFPELNAAGIPEYNTFDLSEGFEFQAHLIRKHIQLSAKDIVSCPEFRTQRLARETTPQYMKRVNSEWKTNQESAFSKFEKSLTRQWPDDDPSPPRAKEIKMYFDVPTALEPIKKLFRAWESNRKFMDYLGRLSKRIQRLKVDPVLAPVFVLVPPPRKGNELASSFRFYSAATIFHGAPPSLSEVKVPDEPNISILEESSPSEQQGIQNSLKHLCDNLAHSQRTGSEKNYVMTLRASCKALKKFEETNKTQRVVVSSELDALLLQHLEDCRRSFEDLNDALAEMTKGTDESSNYITSFLSLAPRLSPSFWLSFLRRERFDTMSASWKSCLVQYGICVVRLNRAQRLLESSNSATDLAVELQNIGHTNWDPKDWPETLLMEAEFGFIVRETQEMIAKEMRHPRGDSNTVMQLNMGEGKSSVVSHVINVVEPRLRQIH